jgi:SAM-dependent methyltransferase
LRNNNSVLENLGKKIGELETKISIIKKRFHDSPTVSQNAIELKREDSALLQKKDIPYGINYFDFENTFRGSRTKIKSIQEQYVSYFKGCSLVLDLGSGRGEFLELLKEYGIGAVGVEIYDEFVEFCRNRDLKVIQQDVLGYLREQKEIDGIFAGQLIEHLPLECTIELCTLAYEKMKPGGYMILETPNPMSLAIFTHSFYMDPTHLKPVHPQTLKYIAERAGFKKVEILFTENSKYPMHIPDLKIKEADNLEEFNKSMRMVEEVLFGSQDYAIIAKR